MTLDEIVTLVDGANEEYGGNARERRARGDVVAYALHLVRRPSHPDRWHVLLYAGLVAGLTLLNLVQAVGLS